MGRRLSVWPKGMFSESAARLSFVLGFLLRTFCLLWHWSRVLLSGREGEDRWGAKREREMDDNRNRVLRYSLAG